MSISLPSELKQFVDNEISSGRYTSEEELFQDAVRLLRSWKKHQLKEKIQLGLEQGEEYILESDEQLGEFFDAIEAEVQQELASKESLE